MIFVKEACVTAHGLNGSRMLLVNVIIVIRKVRELGLGYWCCFMCCIAGCCLLFAVYLACLGAGEVSVQ